MKGMAKVFEVQVPAISKHLNNIFEEGELDKNLTVSKMEIVRKEGKSYRNKGNRILQLRCHYRCWLSC